jgi:hypothetical protein
VRQPFTDPVRAMAMGSATNGPLAVAMAGNRRTVDGGCTLGYFDPATMKELPYARLGMRPGFGIGNERSAAEVRVSTDGTVVTGWGPGTVNGAECSRVLGGQVTRSWHPLAPHPLLPAGDGRALYAPGRVLNPELAAVPARKPKTAGHYVPAHRGDWYASVPVGVVEPAASLEVFRVGNQRPVLTVPAGDVDVSSADHGMDRSVILIPDARVLVTVAGKRDKLVLRRVDLR